MEHPATADFEAFVIGALDVTASAGFVAHVTECDACAARLEGEAKVELAVLEIHAAARRTSPRRRSRTVFFAAAGAIALAAAMLLLLRNRDRDRDATSNASPTMTMTVAAPRAATPNPLVVCPDGANQESCVEDAHRHGLYVSYPPWASAPPLGGGPPGLGPNGSPFGPQQM